MDRKTEVVKTVPVSARLADRVGDAKWATERATSNMSIDQPDAQPDIAEVVVNLRTVIAQIGDAAAPVIPPATGSVRVEPVVAHGALNSMAVLLGALRDISERGANLDAQQTRLLGVAAQQGRLVVAALHDLGLRLPAGATGILDDLDEEARRRHAAADMAPGESG